MLARCSSSGEPWRAPAGPCLSRCPHSCCSQSHGVEITHRSKADAAWAAAVSTGDILDRGWNPCRLQGTSSAQERRCSLDCQYHSWCPGLRLQPLLAAGDYPKSLKQRVPWLPKFTAQQSAALKGSADLFLINNYRSAQMTHMLAPHSHSLLLKAADSQRHRQPIVQDLPPARPGAMMHTLTPAWHAACFAAYCAGTSDAGFAAS